MSDSDSSKTFVVGIDPGLKGGVAIYQPALSLMQAFQTPTRKVSAVKNELCIAAFKELLLTHVGNLAWIKLIAIEKVGAMRKGDKAQGAVSMFTFGKGYGEFLGAIKWGGIPYTEVTPGSWKKEVLLGTDRSKESAVHEIQTRFPDCELPLMPRKKIPFDGPAEAACLALYAAARLANQPKSELVS
jgi:hypothetical protein